MDTDHHKISTHLSSVLDDVGASEDMRQLYWDTSVANGIANTGIFNYFFPGRGTTYHVGSSCEGATTLGLNSDIDVFICLEGQPVIDSINDATDTICCLMVKHWNSKPGYVRLQAVVDGIPQCISLRPAMHGFEEYDDYGRTCVIRPRLPVDPFHARNGPAITFSKGMDSIDYVNALRCRKVPNSANSWIHRTRQYDWPSQKQILRMKSFGCFLVCVAHPKSHNALIEWRISFSLQERELMRGLNPTQHKCYILLKMIKKDIIEPITGESISSYHCKTSLFHTIETSGSSIWTPENLIMCTRMCLERLLDWSKNGNCPNFFIPEQNMFDKLDKQTLIKVNTALTDILSNGTEFLFRMECDKIGARLHHYLSGIPDSKGNIHKTIEYKHNLRVVHSNYSLRNFCLHQIPAEYKSLFIFKRLLTHLQETNHIAEHSTGDVRMALSYIIPHIHLQIAHSLASVEIRRRGAYIHDLLPLDILLNIIESSPSSRVSARISLAALYLQFGMLTACEQLLLAVEASLKSFVVSVCECHNNSLSGYYRIERELCINRNSATTKEFIEQYTTGCLVFLQSQANIVHPALQYEIYRSLFTPGGSRDEHEDYWFDWIVVDPTVYLNFLQYIFCSKNNKLRNSRRIVETFRDLIKGITQGDTLIYHRETAFNVLGWLLVQEHRAIEAWQCFCLSWRLRPFHNAAKWHIVLLLNDVLR